MIPVELLKKIRRIEIRTSHLVNDALAGHYLSAFRGTGMAFEEVRPYQVGDDVRGIDWNVSARLGEPYIKVYREERELTVMLLVDLSPSLDFGTREQRKRDLVTELCATLAFSAIKNSDKVGLIGFTDRVETFIPPRKGTSHVLRVIRELLTVRPTGRGTDLDAALDRLNHVVRRRAVAFLVSDFQDAGYERALRIARRRHDLIAVEVADRHELDLPPVGLMELEDAEMGERRIVNTSSRRWRRRFREVVERERQRREQVFRRLGVDHLSIRTGESYVEPLLALFHRREARR